MRKLGVIIKSIIFVICICCVSIAGIFTYVQCKEYESLKEIEKEMQLKIENEEKIQQQLELELEYNLTDAYVEKIARERLGLVKSTDIVYINENEQ